MTEHVDPLASGTSPARHRTPAVEPVHTPPAPVAGLLQVRSRTVTRMVAETIVVVIGILIAFGLDACWEGRATVAREEAHLRALASDFQQNVHRLKGHIEAEERVSASSRQLLEMARRTSPAPGDSVTRLIGRVFSSGRYEPVMGAYEALVNSAGLTAITDDSLRASLAAFSARVSGRYHERYSDEVYFAFIREFAGRLRFDAFVAEDSMELRSHSALLSDPKFREYLALRYLSERDVARRYRELLAHAEAILTRIESELD